jgi:predicted DNA-binding protein (MmcQ/YjbR family)
MPRKTASKPRKPTKDGTPKPRPFVEFCRGLPHATEDIKWGDDLVFSIGGKMFAVFDPEDSDELAFKCDDEDFDRLTQIDGIIPAPYAARFGWVKIKKTDTIPNSAIKAQLRKAYDLILACLPARTQRALRDPAPSSIRARPKPRRVPK